MKSHRPLPEANWLTPVLLWEGVSHVQFSKESSHGTVAGVILSLSRAIRSKSTQEQSVSMIHLESVSLSVRLVHSTIPELWGLYAACSFHLMLKVLLACTKSATKAGPLSDPMLVGNPNLGTVSLSKHRATSDALSVRVGKASTHPENIHAMTSR